MTEPKKFSFGFSKVAKKPTLLAPKPVETVEYIKCLEDKAVKLVNEEVVKPKELPVIPMPAGSSVRDRILDAIKAREEAKENKSEKKHDSETAKEMQNGEAPKPLTLDEMAAKELLENARVETDEKKSVAVISTSVESANSKQSTLDDYDSMPIEDFGLAMLRGMGWQPTKGIGLNEKVVTPVAPQVRPKGMGLGADKALAAQAQPGKAGAEELVMKKGSTVKVITGPHIHLYGKIEGFEELPGRILVRLTLSNSVVSLNEFMVQLVGPTEYNKNSKVMNLDRYNAALEPETKPRLADLEIKSEPTYRENSSKMSKRDKERSKTPPDTHSERSSSHKSKKKRDRSRDRDAYKKDKYKKRDCSESGSSDRKYRKRESPDRRHKRSKKSKHKSSGSSSESDYREKKRSNKGRHKNSKFKHYKSDSDSSTDKHYKKHKKSLK